MSENNLAILSVRRRIAKSKGELSANIHARMRWVVYAQDRMAENGRTIVMYAEELRRLNKKLEVRYIIHYPFITYTMGMGGCPRCIGSQASCS